MTHYFKISVAQDLIRSALSPMSDLNQGRGSESRYILLLTKNNAALKIIQEQQLIPATQLHVMFGSNFRQDQEYTQICSNISKIKIAMELGHTVILYNLNNLYESLYDALNQNYVLLGMCTLNLHIISSLPCISEWQQFSKCHGGTASFGGKMGLGSMSLYGHLH